MTEPTTEIPAIWERLVTDYADKAVVAIGTALIGIGAVSAPGWAQAGPIVAGMLVWAINGAFAWFSAHAKDVRLREIIKSPPAIPVTK
jgi:hypothetical protein